MVKDNSDTAKAIEAAFIVARMLASYPRRTHPAAAVSCALDTSDPRMLVGCLGAMVASLAHHEAVATGRDVDEILRHVTARQPRWRRPQP